MMINMNRELNFKSSSGSGAVRPAKVISADDPKEIQKLHRKNRRKALRIMYNEQSDFRDLDPEVVANHYDTDTIAQPEDTSFMKEIDPAAHTMNVETFTQREVSKRLRACENTAPGPDGITYNHLKK